MNYNEAVLEQTIATQRKSDKLIGRDKMDYEEFCTAIDEVTHPEMVTDTGLNAREINKAIGKYIKETTGMPYYEIYLSVKFNKPLR